MKPKEAIELSKLLQTKTQIEKMKYAKLLKQQKSALDEANRLRRLSRESSLTEAVHLTTIDLLQLDKYRSQLIFAANRMFTNAESLQLAIQSARAGLQSALQRELAWRTTFKSLEREALKRINDKAERQNEQVTLIKFNRSAKP